MTMRIAVGIATMGRAEIAAAAVQCLQQQTRRPDAVLIAAPTPDDVPRMPHDPAVRWIRSEAGLTRQRNCILREAHGFDIAVFFDDDFLPHPDYLSELENLFMTSEDIVLATGYVVADGIIGPGFRVEEAQRLLKTDFPRAGDPNSVSESYNGYGCNMAVRVSTARRAGVEFDESLPLYGWLEDVDFSRRLRPFGRIVLLPSARGVHLGAKSGRQSGLRLGYSQIANPIYLARKGSFAWLRAARQMARNLAMNIVFSLRPEPYVDRRGRLRGNLLAFRDMVLGKLDPRRILALYELQ